MGVETASKTFIPPQKQPLGRRRKQKMGLIISGVREGRQGRGTASEVTGEAPGLGVGNSQD